MIKKVISETLRLTKIAYEHPRKIIKFFYILFVFGPSEVKKRIKRWDVLQDYQHLINLQYTKWFRNNFPNSTMLKKQNSQSKQFLYQPKISLITPVFNTPINFLTEMMESVLAQSYENWELCIADDASMDWEVREVIKGYAKDDKRIKFVFREKNGHICEASNSALKLATGDYVGLLDHDDVLLPNALFEVVSIINKNPNIQFIYSDEDKLGEDGKTHSDPFFKPDFSPDFFRSVNYITHFTVIKKTLVERVGGFRKGFEGAQDWDLFLRCIEKITSSQIFHIQTVLYSWRISEKSSASAGAVDTFKSYAFKNQKKVLEDDLKRRKISGKVLETQYPNIWRVRYALTEKPLISIIIPTKDRFDYIKRCIDSVLEKSTYLNYEFIITDTGSTDPRVWKYYEQVKEYHSKTKVVKWDKEFNFAAVCNFGAEYAKGKYLLFLNNDTEIVTCDWIESLLEFAQQKDVGAVGCKLLFPNGRIQHAGVVLGIRGGIPKKGVAGHPFKNFFHGENNGSYALVVDAIRNYSAVTAACVMVAAEKFNKVSGFDPIFRIAFNDVDFCLKLQKLGYRNIYTPYSVLIHYESVSVGVPGKGDRRMDEFFKEVDLMHRKWGEFLQHDPFYNVNLTLENEEWGLKV